MKSRSHQLPTTESHPEDWVDGSWTVDCVCGVNFDDGEEMVDCDECGVWVHTRCSHYVKSEKSFACEKCKSKNSGGGAGSGRNDNEETEVAEFLVELPTKTLQMDNPKTSSGPFRLWTNAPMEERVHVQGVPGGEPGFFSGIKMSSVFGPELWKCSGYVPKKFRFPYTEFPCLDDGKAADEKDEMDKRSGEITATQTDNDAGVLVPLSSVNKNTLPSTVDDAVVVNSPVEIGRCGEARCPRQEKKLDCEKLDFACPGDSMKESSSAQPVLLYSEKRKKEKLGMLNYQRIKKKVKTMENEGDVEKRANHSSAAASTFYGDARSEFSQDRGPKSVGDGFQCGKDGYGDQQSVGLGECATNLASDEHGLEATVRNDVSSDERPGVGKIGDQVPLRSENFSNLDDSMEYLGRLGSWMTPIKEEVDGETCASCEDSGGVTVSAGFGSHSKGPVAVDVTIVNLDSKETQTGQDSIVCVANSRPTKKLKSEVDVDNHASRLDDVELDTLKAATPCPKSSTSLGMEAAKVETSFINSEASNLKVFDGTRNMNADDSIADKSDKLLGSHHQSSQEPTVSDCSTEARKRSSGLKRSSEVAEELLNSSGTCTSHSTSYQHKVVVSVGNSASTSASSMSKSSDDYMVAAAQDPYIDIGQTEFSERNAGTMKENATDIVKDDEKCRRLKKLVKETPRLNSLPKMSQSAKVMHKSDSKRVPSDSKDSTVHPSSKLPSLANVTSPVGSSECANPRQADGASNVQNKPEAPVMHAKGEKVYQSGSHLSCKGNVASMSAPSSTSVSATLSDEELALLLHQELNSSPRVPRVPRMRHAGSLPQLTCPSATSVLVKRTSSSGGKDHSMAPRRRTKDFSREDLCGTLEAGNEVKMERKPYSLDGRRREPGCSMDRLSRRKPDDCSAKDVQSMKITNANSSLLSSTDAKGQNLASGCPTSRNASDDDPRMVDRQTNRTLPDLISEIMKEGKRMTYEELCNAVLPHWPHLRKHNGERYAYSSHSQAVLDCLRNRSEWSRLVDRGPKTSTIRKRRKLDADSFSIESEDNEVSRAKNVKDLRSKSFEPHQENFPKGKRNARKRRRLALQGRGIVRRRRRRADVVSDDESESLSESCEDSMSSEEEIQGGRASVGGNGASANSEEVR